MTPLRNQLTLYDLGVRPVLVKVRALDDDYIRLHQRSAAGLTTPEEEARLDRLCAEREVEAGE